MHIQLSEDDHTNMYAKDCIVAISQFVTDACLVTVMTYALVSSFSLTHVYHQIPARRVFFFFRDNIWHHSPVSEYWWRISSNFYVHVLALTPKGHKTMYIYTLKNMSIPFYQTHYSLPYYPLTVITYYFTHFDVHRDFDLMWCKSVPWS